MEFRNARDLIAQRIKSANDSGDYDFAEAMEMLLELANVEVTNATKYAITHPTPTPVTSETGVKVTAYSPDYKFLGKVDVANLKPGMLVRELGCLRTVCGQTMNDGEDFMIELKTDDGSEFYSPLLLV